MGRESCPGAPSRAATTEALHSAGPSRRRRVGLRRQHPQAHQRDEERQRHEPEHEPGDRDAAPAQRPARTRMSPSASVPKAIASADANTVMRPATPRTRRHGRLAGRAAPALLHARRGRGLALGRGGHVGHGDAAEPDQRDDDRGEADPEGQGEQDPSSLERDVGLGGEVVGRLRPVSTIRPAVALTIVASATPARWAQSPRPGRGGQQHRAGHAERADGRLEVDRRRRPGASRRALAMSPVGASAMSRPATARCRARRARGRSSRGSGGRRSRAEPYVMGTIRGTSPAGPASRIPTDARIASGPSCQRKRRTPRSPDAQAAPRRPPALHVAVWADRPRRERAWTRAGSPRARASGRRRRSRRAPCGGPGRRAARPDTSGCPAPPRP